MLFVIFELMKINIQFKDSGTNEQYDLIIEQCEEIFLKKTRDYGTAWRVLRSISIVDQIYIKAQRIRNIQEVGAQKVENLGDDIRSEFIGIINYSIIGLMQLELTENDPEEALNGTTVMHSIALMNGAHILRVHDVKEAVQAVKLYSAYSKAKEQIFTAP